MTELTPGPTGTDEVLFGLQAGAARIHLNRPKALNSLTTEMVDAITERLRVWSAADEPPVAVVVTGEGEKGLCAGGDIRVLRESALSGDPVLARRFWGAEYELNAMIADYALPYVALMHGVVMGGGIGISAHGTHRLVRHDARIAMPETGIGFFPDVGALHLLAQAPQELGAHLALTGAHIAGDDAVTVGLADVVSSDSVDRIFATLERSKDADELVASTPATTSPLMEQAGWIEECYDSDDAAEVVGRLENHSNPAAREAGALLRTRSPLSACVTMAALRAAESSTLAEVLERDLRIGAALLRSGDFAEGVRAVLVDRTNDPAWRHSRIEDVTEQEVDHILRGQPLD